MGLWSAARLVVLSLSCWLGLVGSVAGKPSEGTGAQGARWQEGVVRIAVEHSLDAAAPQAFEELIRAISTWQGVDAVLPTLVAERTGRTKLGFNPKGPNVNTVRYDARGSKLAKGALAITIITFDQHRGVILDADIIVNGEHRFGVVERMSDIDIRAQYDLQNVLAHEMGHFLGLGEEYEIRSATMYAYSMPGETTKRELDPVDLENVMLLYDGEPELNAAAGCAAGASIVGGLGGYDGYWWVILGAGATAVYLARRRALRSSLVAVGALLWVGAGFQAQQQPSYLAEVSALQSRWDDGLIVSTATLRPADCPTCPARRVELLGGTIGNISQKVGLNRPLKVGDSVRMVSSSGSGLQNRHGSPLLIIEE